MREAAAMLGLLFGSCATGSIATHAAGYERVSGSTGFFLFVSVVLTFTTWKYV
jgi:hypothetical protein